MTKSDGGDWAEFFGEAPPGADHCDVAEPKSNLEAATALPDMPTAAR
jgi:hypothetical protein